MIVLDGSIPLCDRPVLTLHMTSLSQPLFPAALISDHRFESTKSIHHIVTGFVRIERHQGDVVSHGDTLHTRRGPR